MELPVGGKEKFLAQKAFDRKVFKKADLKLDFTVRAAGFQCKKPDPRGNGSVLVSGSSTVWKATGAIWLIFFAGSLLWG